MRFSIFNSRFASFQLFKIWFRGLWDLKPLCFSYMPFKTNFSLILCFARARQSTKNVLAKHYNPHGIEMLKEITTKQT